MSDLRLSATEQRMQQANRRLAIPELDEGVWLAWLEKNRAKDRIRTARRRRVLLVLIGSAAVALFAAYSVAAIA